MAEKCRHNGEIDRRYTHVRCKECGWVKTDLSHDWGLARNSWFSTIENAEFYQKHGRLPAPLSEHSKDQP